jgi:hypothetical protein
MTNIAEKFTTYFAISKELAALRKQQTALKKQSDILEREIKEHMTANDLDSLSFKEGQIILYDRKNLQTFKKESMVECLKEELGDPNRAEQLADTIISNKVYKMEKRIKVNLKK